MEFEKEEGSEAGKKESKKQEGMICAVRSVFEFGKKREDFKKKNR